MPDAADPNILLETERLLLRYQLTEDIPFLSELWADPVVTRYVGGPRERDWLWSVFAETAKTPQAERYDLWPAVDKETGRLVGHCGLLDKEIDGRAEIEVNYFFASTEWGKGYGAEICQALIQFAFGQPGVTRIVALINPENTPSERVAVQSGLHFEREVLRPGGAVRRLFVRAKTSG